MVDVREQQGGASELPQIKQAILDALDNAGPDLVDKAVRAIYKFTQAKMYALEHVPTRYYLPPEDGDEEAALGRLATLYYELGKHGRILLDQDGEPCCLSGKEPAMETGLPVMIDPGHVIFCMILDMMKACVKRTGEEPIILVITHEMAELLWDYGNRERGGFSMSKDEWFSRLEATTRALSDKELDEQAWSRKLKAADRALLGLPTCLGPDFEVIGIDKA